MTPNNEILSVTHYGKPYNFEDAIISMTSWKDRINIAHYTVFSLIKLATRFHLVLVLSSDEFPNKEHDLPQDLLVFCKANLLEILWIQPNLKSFKKILITMKEYPSTPIISADDGLIYNMNYAQILYDSWKNNPRAIFVHEIYSKYGFSWGVGGKGIIFPPDIFSQYIPKCFSEYILNTNHDDGLYGALAKLTNTAVICTGIEHTKIYSEIESANECGLGRRHLYSDSVIPYIFKELQS